MNTAQFGSRPYKGSLYGPATEDELQGKVTDEADEMKRLQWFLSRLKAGDFGMIRQLKPLLESKDYDVRQYACQLFAHVCNQQQSEELKLSLIHADSASEIQRVILRLGETLSRRAIPVILQFRQDIGDSEIDEYIYDAIEMILGSSAKKALDLTDQAVVEKYSDFTAELDSSMYLYYGQPIFIGDVTKELITAATISLKTQKNSILGYQPQLLSNFSGIPCPVHYGDIVSEKIMQDIYTYVKMLAGRNWIKGRKYFCGHLID